MIDFGLVKRAECGCGVVIIIASNATDEQVAATIRRHNAIYEHRAMYGGGYYPPETPSTPSVVGELRAGLTTRGADRLPEGEVSSPPSGDGVSIRRDGYDFDLPPARSRRDLVR